MLTDKILVVITQFGHFYNLVSWSGFLYSNFNFHYHSVDVLPGAVILLKDNQLKKQQITSNTEQFKGRNLLQYIQVLVSAVHKISFKNLVTN